MKTKIHSVKASKHSVKTSNKKVSVKRSRKVISHDAVALAVGRALMRKPKVNPFLLKIMRENRDLLPA
jgi:hypothetical protein